MADLMAVVVDPAVDATNKSEQKEKEILNETASRHA